MSSFVDIIVIAVEIGLAITAAEFARRAQRDAVDARYEAEFAKRCAARARAAAQYCHAAAAHLAAHSGVPLPTVLRTAWDDVWTDPQRARTVPTDGGPKTPA